MKAFTDRKNSPGRWYASLVVKYLLAHLLVNYDMKLPDNSGGRPPDNVYAGVRVANTKAKVLFRQRTDIGHVS